MASEFDYVVEFLDLDVAEDAKAHGGGAGDEIDWQDEPGGEERVTSGRDPRRLPPRATRGRALASLLSVAMLLGTAAGVGTKAYHRLESDLRIANTLNLAASPAAPSIPGLTGLTFQREWHAHLAEQVVIPVVNRGPETITLVDGELTETGLHGTPMFKPVGKAAILPGGTGELVGMVTADCATEQSDDGVTLVVNPATGGTVAQQPGPTDGNDIGADGAYTGTVTVNGLDGNGNSASLVQASKRASVAALQVRARSAGGRVGEETIFPETGTANMADRICTHQGWSVVQSIGLKTKVNPRTRSITVSLTSRSIADTALDYSGTTSWVTAPVAPGPMLNSHFIPTSATGQVQPGRTFTVSFQVTIDHCPVAAMSNNDNIMLSVMFAFDNELVSVENASVGSQELIYEACRQTR